MDDESESMGMEEEGDDEGTAAAAAAEGAGGQGDEASALSAPLQVMGPLGRVGGEWGKWATPSGRHHRLEQSTRTESSSSFGDC